MSWVVRTSELPTAAWWTGKDWTSYRPLAKVYTDRDFAAAVARTLQAIIRPA